jgi:uncharacterized protein DUF4411
MRRADLARRCGVSGPGGATYTSAPGPDRWRGSGLPSMNRASGDLPSPSSINLVPSRWSSLTRTGRSTSRTVPRNSSQASRARSSSASRPRNSLPLPDRIHLPTYFSLSSMRLRVEGPPSARAEPTAHAVASQSSSVTNAAIPAAVSSTQVNGCTVVTDENSRPTRPRIPDVCGGLGIPCINMLELIRAEGWKYRS